MTCTDNIMFWSITKDLITSTEERKEGKTWESYSNTKNFDKYVSEANVKFRLLDDDGEVYLEGIATSEDFDAQDYFEPLLGVTETQVWNASKESWETL